jgi:thiol-disulfide isomerase/thioredoxin
MAAHRRRTRTSRIPGLVRLSAVSLSVATAALATAYATTGLGGGDDAQRVSAASAPEDPAALEAAGTGSGAGGGSGAAADPAGAVGAAASAAASASSAPSASASVSATPSAGTADPAAPARPAAPATKAPAKPAAKPAPAPGPTKGGGAPASGDSGFVPGYPSGSDARQAVKAAVAAAEADGKKVLVDFGANWCGNCKAADEVFGTSAVGKLLDASYHVVKVDIGSQGGSSAGFDLLRTYCSGEGAYKMPVLVVLDGSGRVVTETHSTGNPSLTADGLSAFLRQWA